MRKVPKVSRDLGRRWQLLLLLLLGPRSPTAMAKLRHGTRLRGKRGLLRLLCPCKGLELALQARSQSGTLITKLLVAILLLLLLLPARELGAVATNSLVRLTALTTR